jgi:uncharacterized protein YjiS (DUF1127 family)
MTRAHDIATSQQLDLALSERVRTRVARIWRAYWRRRAQHATVRLLHSLDDRTLHDIGVGRSEISSMVYGRRGDRVRSYEEAWRIWHLKA